VKLRFYIAYYFFFRYCLRFLNWSWIIIYYLHFIHQFKWTLRSRAIFSISGFHSRDYVQGCFTFWGKKYKCFFFLILRGIWDSTWKKNRRYKNDTLDYKINTWYFIAPWSPTWIKICNPHHSPRHDQLFVTYTIWFQNGTNILWKKTT
jgi:hypothetical protein